MLTVEKKIKRKQALPTNYQTEQDLVWDIPTGDIFVELLLRVYGTVTLAVADATSLAVGGMERIVRSLKLIADWKTGGLDSAIRSYTGKGVHDAAGGRTASYAGRMLALENLIDMGTPVVKTEPGLTQAAQPVEIVFPLRLWTPRSARPYRTMLDSRKLNSLSLEIRTGIADSTAAGADTDLHVIAAGGTSVASLAWDLTAVVRKDIPAEGQDFDIRRTRSLAKELSVDDDLELEIGEKANYRRLLLACLDSDVLSDARVTDLKVKIDKYADVVDRSWGDLQASAKQRYSLEAALSGFNVIDFRGILGTQEANDVDLVMKTPAGAVVAEDKMLVVSEDVVLAGGRPGAPVGQARVRRPRRL